MQDPINGRSGTRRGEGNLRMGMKRYMKITAEQLDQIEQVRGVWEKYLCEDGIVRLPDGFRYDE